MKGNHMAADLNEDELLRRARAGDEAALGDLFAHYRGRLRQMVRLRLDRRVYVRIDPSDFPGSAAEPGCGRSPLHNGGGSR
jgi:hypothetical protein